MEIGQVVVSNNGKVVYAGSVYGKDRLTGIIELAKLKTMVKSLNPLAEVTYILN